MGDVEDTFTKQEIQAGYVTSGRDVLARQQQIVQQALSAASGAAGSAPRRKVGGGGPSGTGKLLRILSFHYQRMMNHHALQLLLWSLLRQ